MNTRSSTYRERKKPGFRCLDQLAIVERTGTALAILERLVFKPERAGEFDKVGLLVHDRQAAISDAIGADPGRDGAPLHSGEHVAREQPAQAIKFRDRRWAAEAPGRDARAGAVGMVSSTEGA